MNTRTSFTFASEVTSTSPRSTSFGFPRTRSFVPALRFSFFARLMSLNAATGWRDSSRLPFKYAPRHVTADGRETTGVGMRGAVRSLVLLVLVLAAPRALAQAAPPAPHEDI